MFPIPTSSQRSKPFDQIEDGYARLLERLRREHPDVLAAPAGEPAAAEALAR